MPTITSCLLTVLVLALPGTLQAANDSLAASHSLVRTETWSETWLDDDGVPQSRQVMGELWTEAFQAVLSTHQSVHIPAREKPYYLDGPLVLQSGYSLTADPQAVIRLKPGTNTCMVRNQSVVGFADRKVPSNLQPDTDIVIEGGIWSTLALGNRIVNGNDRGHSSKENPVPGTHGVILLQNACRVTVRNVTVRQSRPFAVHLGNVRAFVVDGLTLDRHRRDGVHVNGPASDGVIRNVRGDSHDDMVALNAWEWQNYAPSFGPIHHVSIQHVAGSLNRPSSDSIRLLPGLKQFEDGSTLDCSIHHITLRNLTDIREYKLYDQPNLEMGRQNDFSLTLGKLRNIQMQQLVFTRPGEINIAADVDGLCVDDVDLQFTPTADFKLIKIGPMSMTWRSGADPSRWVEVFSPDRDVTVRGFQLGRVTVNGQTVPDPETRFLQVKDQQINPDYPKTTPRGGTGKAILVR